MRRFGIVGCVIALALAVAFPGSAATPAGAVFTAVVTDVQKNVPNRVITLYQIRDRKSSIVGWGSNVCLSLHNGGFLCWGTYVLPKGKISVLGTRRNRAFYTLAIVGGTGSYNGWGGTLIGRQYAPDKERLVFEGLAP